MGIQPQERMNHILHLWRESQSLMGTYLFPQIQCVLHFTPQMHTFSWLFHFLLFLRELVNGFLLHRVSSLEIVGLQSFCIMNISLKIWVTLDNWQVWISLLCSKWNFEQLVDSVTCKNDNNHWATCGIQWTKEKRRM